MLFHRKIRCLIIFILITHSLCAQGLKFLGNNYLIDERTSYSVFSGGPKTIKSDLFISFDLSIQQFNQFGYIFRLKEYNTKSIYNLTFTYLDDTRSTFRFNLEGRDNLLSVNYTNDSIIKNKWIPMSFHFFESLVEVNFNGIKYEIKLEKKTSNYSIELFFGRNEHFLDLPSFALKNLIVGRKDSPHKFYFNESSGVDVYDSEGRRRGVVENPFWLINDSYYWKELFCYNSETVSCLNYHSIDNSMLFCNSDSIIVFNLDTNEEKSIKYKNSCPVDLRLGQSFIDEFENKLYVYEVNNLPAGVPTIASFDFKSKMWSIQSRSFLSNQLHHHAFYYDETDKSLYLFGGFGNQVYSDKLLRYDILNDKWDTLSLSGDKIDPRFFTSLAPSSDHRFFYLFGGVGNKSGDQTIGYNYYYDLYKIDRSTFKVKKMWNILWSEEKNVVPAKQLIINNDSSFYALCYPEHTPKSKAYIYEFDISSGKYQRLGDSISVVSEKINTNINIFRSKKQNELYCVVQEFGDDDIPSISKLYSISASPISSSALSRISLSSSFNWMLLMVVFTVFLLLVLLIIRRKNRNKMKYNETNLSLNELFNKDKSNSIYLFGEFSAYDAKGKDISYMFSNRLKSALFVIIYYTLKNDGATSSNINSALWPDRSSDDSLKNLRGVTLSQLRKVLSEFNGVKIHYENARFKFIAEEHFYCDVLQFVELIHKKNIDLSDTTYMTDLKNILSRGLFLKSETDFDEIYYLFKEEIDNHIESVLPFYVNQSYKDADYVTCIKLCDFLLQVTETNEFALYYKIHSLVNLKQLDEAHRVFALFLVAYSDLNKADYPLSFTKFMSHSFDI